MWEDVFGIIKRFHASYSDNYLFLMVLLPPCRLRFKPSSCTPNTIGWIFNQRKPPVLQAIAPESTLAQWLDSHLSKYKGVPQTVLSSILAYPQPLLVLFCSDITVKKKKMDIKRDVKMRKWSEKKEFDSFSRLVVIEEKLFFPCFRPYPFLNKRKYGSG